MGSGSINPCSGNNNNNTDLTGEIVERRLAVLELARQLGNVSEACRRCGINRTTYYLWKRQYDSFGRDGLADRPNPARAHPMRTPLHVENRICALSLENPSRGCNWLEKHLAFCGLRISAITIQKVLNRQSIGTRRERWLTLEADYASGKTELTAEQINFIESFNPCFRDRNSCAQRPGEVLCAQTATIGWRARGKRIKLHMIVDVFGSFAFAAVEEPSSKRTFGQLLVDDVLPWYEEWGLSIRSFQLGTEIGKIEWGETVNPRDLTDRGISLCEHAWWVGGRNGCMERFHRTAVEEFFKPAVSENRHRSVSALRSGFKRWLHHYNVSRPHPGYRNYGKPPAQFLGVES